MYDDLWYTPNEESDGDAWVSAMPESMQKSPFPSNGPMKWAN